MPDQLFGLGAIPSPPDARDEAYHLSTLGLEAVPTLPVTIPHLPLVWNQGNTGTCVGHGVLLAIAVALYRKLGYWIVSEPVFAEQSARDLYLQTTGDKTLQLGADIRSALKVAASIGVLGKDKSGKVQRFKITSYHTLLPSANVELAVEAAIASGMVVIAGMNWPEDWMIQKAVVLPDPPQGEQSAGGHCIGFWRAIAGSPVANCLRNSWGATWGNGFGNAYVHAPTFVQRAFDLWVVQG